MCVCAHIIVYIYCINASIILYGCMFIYLHVIIHSMTKNYYLGVSYSLVSNKTTK